MSDVYTFDAFEVGDKDVKVKFTLTVKSEFLEKCPEPEKLSPSKLNSEFYMVKYLHNPSGPAIIRHDEAAKKCKNGPIEYWMDGVCLNVENIELAEKIKHNHLFNAKLLYEVND